MTLKGAWKTFVVLFGVFCLLYACACAPPEEAHADVQQVIVDPAVPDQAALKARIERKVMWTDDVYVTVFPVDDVDNKDTALESLYRGKILILAYANDLYVRGNDWVPQVVMDEALARVKNVNRSAGDRIIGMIVEVHKYQDAHAKPAPPPPPPPPPAPPAPPEPPFDWHPFMIYIYVGVPVLILFLIWLPLELRRRKRYGRLAAAADEQADWSLNQYGIKSTVD